MTKQFSTAMVGGYYKFDLKVYYSDKNLFRDYYQRGGEAQNATVSLKIASPQGTTLKQFDGFTNNQGYFEGEFIVPKDAQPGQYLVFVNAKKDGSISSNDLVLSIVEQPMPSTTTESQALTGPTITLNGTNPQTINKNSSYTELGATATDVEDGDLTASIVIDSSSVNTSVVGAYSVTYSVTEDRKSVV